MGACDESYFTVRSERVLSEEVTALWSEASAVVYVKRFLELPDERREHASILVMSYVSVMPEVLLRVLGVQARRHVADATTKVTRKRGNHSGLSFRKRQRRTSFRCSFWRTRSMSGWSIPHK